MRDGLNHFMESQQNIVPQYLNWFVFLEKIKKSINPLMDLAEYSKYKCY